MFWALHFCKGKKKELKKLGLGQANKRYGIGSHLSFWHQCRKRINNKSNNRKRGVEVSSVGVVGEGAALKDTP